MNWTTADDLKKQLLRLWERGELLRDLATGNQRFPLRLTLKRPGSVDITERFDAVRKWSNTLTISQQFRLEWLEVSHRVQGRQRLPGYVWIDSLDDALSWIGKLTAAKRFEELLALTQKEKPELLPWIVKNPLKALELADIWPKFLAIVSWIVEHPRPNMYVRQIDIPGIHSKFIETHRNILAQFFDLALPSCAIDSKKTGIDKFAARYGFLEKTAGIRFRVLDDSLLLIGGTCCPEITLDAESFSRLTILPKRVFITENETNFLAFPRQSNAIVLFGAGYGWDAIARSQWLHHCAIQYWGDIDTHGFAILDQLRAHFPHVSSFLMDRATLEEHRANWGVEEKATSRELTNLSPQEKNLYDDLRNHRIRKKLRLEQEYIGFTWLQNYLSSLQ